MTFLDYLKTVLFGLLFWAGFAACLWLITPQ